LGSFKDVRALNKTFGVEILGRCDRDVQDVLRLTTEILPSPGIMHDYLSENKISTMTKVPERPKGAKSLHKYE
jgi:hypothetical protein